MTGGPPSRRPIALVAAVLAVAASTYVALFLTSDIFDPQYERTLPPPTAAAAQVRAYLEPIAVDAVRDALQVRVTLQPAAAGASPALAFDRDLDVALLHDGGGERVALHAGLPATSIMVELDLGEGDISRYPLDAYQASIVVRCTGPAGSTVPVAVTVWERVHGFRLRARAALGAPGDIAVALRIRRGFAFECFALAAYGAMGLLACAALTIGTLIVLRVRRPEPTLFGALAGIVFALPAMRNTLPGAPPLGVLADVLVFFWAELTAVAALAMTVATWALKGPRP